MPILLINNVRHWENKHSAIWVETRWSSKHTNTLKWQCATFEKTSISLFGSKLFDLQNMPILLINNVRHWENKHSAIWVETRWSSKHTNTLKWQCATFEKTSISLFGSKLFDLQNMPILLINNVRHWENKHSAIWVETLWSSKHASTLNWQGASLG